MNSLEFTSELSKKLQVSKTEISKRIIDVAQIVSDELVKGNTISLGNLGALTIHKRGERESINPSSGKKMLVPPKLVVKLKVSSSLKEKVKTLKP